MTKFVSLCIPTNGIVKWVIPVLESIYSQNVDDSLFEVVITDNGKDSKLENHLIPFLEQHDNLKYEKTTDYQFLNQISCFKKASGQLIKFINHRMVLENGFLNVLINFSKENINEKPVIYYLNGMLNIPGYTCYKSFNDFVYALQYWSSWSAGLCIWKTDFMEICEQLKPNPWFPHLDLLFAFTNKKQYIIDNNKYLTELPTDESIKGKYNFWKVFAVEYLEIILNLLKNNHITYKTFNFIRNKQFTFLSLYYYLYIIRKLSNSYDTGNVKEYINIFYGKFGYIKLKIRSYTTILVKFAFGKLLNIFRMKK